MEIDFEDERFGRLCNDLRQLRRKHGEQRAKLIGRRLAALDAAECLEDLRFAPGRLHELTADRRGEFTFDLDGPYRLLCRPAENPAPVKDDGGLDWSSITAVTVIGVVDTH